VIALVDLKISNLGSVLEAFRRIGAPPTHPATAGTLSAASAVVLPGVGAFGDGMNSLREQGLVEPIRQAAARRVPVLGICLGMQLLADQSEEHGHHPGLGLIPGNVRKLAPTQAGFRVPNIGWCDVRPTRRGELFPDEATGCFYHVHSFHLIPADTGNVAGTMEYSGSEVVSAVERGNVMGVQFHPEKSQDDGLRLLARFFAFLRRSGRV
jgi:glutamine amidotransferase